jgi:hypothetical protein
VQPTATIDRELLATSMSWLLAGIALLVLDVRLSAVGVGDGALGALDLLFDPVGAVVIALGIERVLAATPATTTGTVLRVVAWLHVVLSGATEVGVLTGQLTVGGAGVADAAEATVPWRAVATATLAATVLGVGLLADHLRRVLPGIAADRWRQVTIAWLVTLVALPLVLLVGALELVFLGLAVTAIAGVLLLVALFATRRAAEDDVLDRDFER